MAVTDADGWISFRGFHGNYTLEIEEGGRPQKAEVALDIPWIVHWELFCNEPNDGTKPDRRVRKAEELKGFWYVRPDGSLGWGGRYLDSLLRHAGGSLPAISTR